MRPSVALLLALALSTLGSCRCSEPLRAIPDAGASAPLPSDAGAPQAALDAGPPPALEDAGAVTDAGSLSSDAGTVTDAGAVAPADAGPPPPPPPPPSDGGVPSYGGPCGPVEMSPGYAAEAWGEVQSQPGNGYQVTITLSFPCPVQSVTVTAYDPDFPQNVMIALDVNNTELTRALFVGDGLPGVLTTDTRTVTSPGAPIHTVLLSPDPLDYVTYGNISYTVP